MNDKILPLQIDSLYLQSVAIKNLKWCLSGFASRKCWVWRGKTKLLMVSNKEESLQALCGNLSFSPAHGVETKQEILFTSEKI